MRSLRDDDDEFGWMNRAVWTTAALLFATFLLFAKYPDLDLVNKLIFLSCFAFVVTYAHGPILSPAPKKWDETPDLIDRLIRWVDDYPTMEPRHWWTYAVLRYVLPCFVAGVVIDNPLFAVSGIFITLGYWPISFQIAQGENTKYVGAGLAGFFLFASI